jgi:hypothetical protein
VNLLIYILKVIVIMGMTAGWNEGRKANKRNDRTWVYEMKIDSVKVDSIRMVMK